jgi:hypothetical protein
VASTAAAAVSTALHRNVDVAGHDTGEGARQLVMGGKGLLGDVEGAVNDASDVDLGDGEPGGPGQLLGEVVQVRMESTTAAWPWR